MPELVLRSGRAPSRPEVDSLAGHDQRVPAGLDGSADVLQERLLVVRFFRNERHIGSSRKTGSESHPPGVSTHDLEDDGAVVAAGGVAQSFESVHGHRRGRMESERPVGARDVVVHRFRDPDDVSASTVQLAGGRERIVPSDRDERAQPMSSQGLEEPGRVRLLGERIGPRTPEDRAALSEDVRDIRDGERSALVVANPLPAVQEPDGLVTELGRATDHRTDRRVQAGAVSSAREDSELHAGTSRYERGAVEELETRLRNHDVVFDTNPALSGEVDARLDGERHSFPDGVRDLGAVAPTCRGPRVRSNVPHRG